MANIPPDRIEAFIYEAQQQDLRPVLNDALYTDFMTDQINGGTGTSGLTTHSDYNILLAGEVYTYGGRQIEFPGLKPLIAYHTLARFVQNNPINIVSYGIVIKTGDKSAKVDQTAINNLYAELRAIAVGYAKETRKYLYNNVARFQLYGYNYGARDINSGGVRFF
jgi:hypothetical protein